MENVTPFLDKMNNTKKNFKIIHFDNAGEKKTLEEKYTQIFEEINFEFRHST